jgi:Potential Queuosine, Q, salvage protein family
MEIVDQIRRECARVAGAATHVRINHERIPDYGSALQQQRSPARQSLAAAGPAVSGEERERAAAYWMTLNAVNYGSGWFPTLLKMPGMTGYRTIKAGIDRRFKDDGPWSAQKLQRITMAEISTLMMQEPDHPLMPLFKASMRDLGAHIEAGFDGRFTNVIEAAGRRAVQLVETLGTWECFADVSQYQGRDVPFLKRAQIAAADLQRAGAASWTDVDRLTLFADNLVPHVLRLDGVLSFDDALVEQIAQQQLIEHGSPQEVEYRACALHAVELIADATGRTLSPAVIDELLWNRGQQPQYKAVPRPRSRSTAY